MQWQEEMLSNLSFLRAERAAATRWGIQLESYEAKNKVDKPCGEPRYYNINTQLVLEKDCIPV